MSKYLIKVTEQYRCDSEAEAIKLLTEAKADSRYIVTKSSSEIKTIKQKGEIQDEWRRVIITKEFTDEKNPDSDITVNYIEGFENE